MWPLSEVHLEKHVGWRIYRGYNNDTVTAKSRPTSDPNATDYVAFHLLADKFLPPFHQPTQESPSRLSKTCHLNGMDLDWGTQLSILISIMYSNRLIVIAPSPDHRLLLKPADHKVRRSIRDFSRDFYRFIGSAVRRRKHLRRQAKLVLLLAHSNEAINIKCLPWQWNLQS